MGLNVLFTGAGTGTNPITGKVDSWNGTQYDSRQITETDKSPRQAEPLSNCWHRYRN